MTLSEYINTQGPETVVAVGSTAGFLFIGTPGEFWRDVDRINAKIVEGYTHTLLRTRDAEKDAEGKRERYRKKIENYVTIQNRRVLGTYRTRDGQVNVKIEGPESGAYWLRSEYNGIPEEDFRESRDPEGLPDIAENYSKLSMYIVRVAAQDYETAYRRMRRIFGGREFIPGTLPEAVKEIQSVHGALLSDERIHEYYRLRKFFLSQYSEEYSGGFSLHSGADPLAVLRHIEDLVDRGSSLREQAAELERVKPRERDNFAHNQRRKEKRDAEKKARAAK